MRTKTVLAGVALIAAVLTATIAAPALAALRDAGDYWFVGKWGGLGSGDGQFDDPNGVAVAPDGTVYVYDGGNFRVQWFTPGGAFLGKYGSEGFEDGQFKYAAEIAVDPSGEWVYVCDSDEIQSEIEQFAVDPSFAHARAFWPPGQHTRSAFDPNGVDVAADGDVFVVDKAADRVVQFSSAGTLLAQWGSAGTGNGQFLDPGAIAVAPAGSPHAGRVYVADSGNKRVQYFDPLPSDPPTDPPTYGYAGQWTVDATFGPEGIDVGSDGLVYVCGLFSPHCRYYTADGGVPPDTTGTPLGSWSTGSDAGGMFRPWSIAVAPPGSPLAGRVYVADTKYGPGTPEEVSNDSVMAYMLDPQAPLTVDDAPRGPVDSPSGWSRVPLAVTLTRSDDCSGVFTTYYRFSQPGSPAPAWEQWRGIDPIGCTPPIFPSPDSSTLPELGDGVYTLEYYSEDNASRPEATLSVPVRVDSRPPESRDDLNGAGGWRGSPVTVHYTVIDGLSGVAETQSSIDGGLTWHGGGSYTVTAEGEIAVDFRSRDVAGNVETPKRCMVWTDFTAPTTVDDAPSGWTRGPVTVHLTAGDAKAGVNKTSGAWHTNVSLTGPGADGVWQVASSVTVAGEGEYTLAYYSTDQAANAEAQKTCRIRLDNSPPVPAALAHVAVTRGRTAKLRYRVRDTWSPACTVTIKVVNARGRTVKTFRLGSRPTGVSLAKSFRCTLPKGTYRWQVHATDAAGNVQARAGSRLLIVR